MIYKIVFSYTRTREADTLEQYLVENLKQSVNQYISINNKKTVIFSYIFIE